MLSKLFSRKVLVLGEFTAPCEEAVRNFRWYGDEGFRWFGFTRGLTLFHWCDTGWYFPELRISRPSELRPDLRVIHLSVGRFSIVYHPK